MSKLTNQELCNRIGKPCVVYMNGALAVEGSELEAAYNYRGMIKKERLVPEGGEKDESKDQN